MNVGKAPNHRQEQMKAKRCQDFKEKAKNKEENEIKDKIKWVYKREGNTRIRRVYYL